jgi:hypothetical protein
MLLASYHTEALGVTDLIYVQISNDGGDTWSEPRAPAVRNRHS